MCVIINPKHIMEQVWCRGLSRGDATVEIDDDKLMTCMLFMDSLKAHQKAQVKKNLMLWLNSEWKRLKKGEEGEPEEPFTTNTLVAASPRGTYVSFCFIRLFW